MEYVQDAARQQLAEKTTTPQIKTLALFIFSFIAYLLAMYWRIGLEVADDGAFFLRYAQNMLAGQFWVWNLGEAPVWGASAPFYPVLLAIAMFFGLSPEHSIIVVGSLLTALSFSFLVVLFARQLSLAAGLAFLVFTAMDTGTMYFSVGGLESPLTLLLLSLAAWSLFRSRSLSLIGAVAGLLMANKLDLAPIGGLLLLALWARNRAFPIRAFFVAGIIALAWYGFAWLYFGAPVPNSFLTKSLHQEDLPKIIDWTWFGTFVYWGGAHKWLTLLAIFGSSINFKKNLHILIFLIGTLATHTIAYTVKYPFEPYNWYCMPSVFCLIVLACLGINNILSTLENRISKNKITIIASTALILSTYAYTNSAIEIATTDSIKKFAGLVEYDRAEAGRWVDVHTPKEFKLLTYWGNPSFHSEREVIDGSFLNRRFENNNLVDKYRPEIIILQANPGSNPMQPNHWVMQSGYKVVKVFDESYSHDLPFYFSVLAREDIIDKITDVTPPKGLLQPAFRYKAG